MCSINDSINHLWVNLLKMLHNWHDLWSHWITRTRLRMIRICFILIVNPILSYTQFSRWEQALHKVIMSYCLRRWHETNVKWLIVSWSPWNTFQWNFNRSSPIVILPQSFKLGAIRQQAITWITAGQDLLCHVMTRPQCGNILGSKQNRSRQQFKQIIFSNKFNTLVQLNKWWLSYISPYGITRSQQCK